MKSAAFVDSGLTSVTLPEGIVSLEDGLFQGCVNLKTVHIPSTVTEIGKDCFKDCPAKITVSPDNPVFKSVDGALVRKEEARP